jgi:hypothetical protein
VREGDGDWIRNPRGKRKKIKQGGKVQMSSKVSLPER